ncbi:MAG TPA: integrase domain-containing protein [Scandinavium sp.]
MSKLHKNLSALARRAEGSFKTIADRMKIAHRFADRLLVLNIQIRDMRHVKTSYIRQYIRSRQEENIASRTLQNEMSVIRSLLKLAGKTAMADPTHPVLNNRALGIAGASREGTKVAIPEMVYQQALQQVFIKNEGAGCVMALSRLLGLRAEEAVQSAKSLQTWQRALIRGESKIRVVFGTKGGRPRDTTVLKPAETLRAIESALACVARQNGKLIDKPALHLAIEQYRNVVRDAGLTGKHSPHSLRYAWAMDAIQHYRQQGFSEKEALAMVSMDLGHGDGRGYYVARVYNKVDVE